MNKGIYTKCDLLCIQDDFNIQDNLSVKDSIIDCDKKTLSSIIVSSISNKMCEVLTGVEFDYSDINVHCYYSKFLNKGVTKRRIKHSSEPIHVSLYSETFSDLGFSNMNYKYVDDSDIKQYYHDVIVEFNTLDNYKKYLLSLKEMAYNILNDAIKNCDKVKKIKLTRIV